MPYLVLDSGEGSRVQVPLTAKGVRMGRDPDCDLVIPAEAASRHHATVTLEKGKPVFRDLGSHNGSLVNGVGTQERVLRDGDRIGIGGFTVLYIERDPYGNDSLEMTAAGLPETPEPAPAPEPAVAPVAPPRGKRRPVLLALVSVLCLLIAAALLIAVWFAARRFSPRAPSPTWSDPSGLLSVFMPPEFHTAEARGGSARFLGPGGGRFASSIAIAVDPASPNGSAGSEIDLAERALHAQDRAAYVRLGSGDIAIGDRQGRYLLYQRHTPEGIVLQSFLVLAIVDGRRVSFRLTSELGTWATVEPLFTDVLKRARIGAQVER